MRVIRGEEVDRLVGMPAMIEAMRAAFRSDIVEPIRHHHRIERGDADASTLLLMPAWTAAGVGASYTGVKIVTVAPNNARRGLASVVGSYLLNDGATGEPLALIDGPALTARRTAAASALAASYLARVDAACHLVLGAGAMSPFLGRSMRTVRPIGETLVWNRSSERAQAVADRLAGEGIAATAVRDLEAAVRRADIVSAATLSREPLILGAWLAPGTHLDLVGAFTPEMRETDDAAVALSRVFVDTRAGALAEGGDLLQAIASGAFSAGDVIAELSDLVRGNAAGRTTDEEITLFKSVGAAREDLAAAVLVYERALVEG
ncbi:MAG: ornithine cyclodeaminase family protein [Rhizobiaceae bacterium]|nr:ornithine cyclodeaminase family protein [Rhizobiaceae bacterium]